MTVTSYPRSRRPLYSLCASGVAPAMMMWFFLMTFDRRPLTRRFRLPPIIGPIIALIEVANTVIPMIMMDTVNSLLATVCGVISPYPTVDMDQTEKYSTVARTLMTG